MPRLTKFINARFSYKIQPKSIELVTESNMEYSLVPEKDLDGNETGFYTREPDGVSGMTVSALAVFVGAKQQTITQLLNRVRDSAPITNSLPETLRPFAGIDLRLITNDLQGRRIVPDEVCQSVAEYYAFDARDFEGKDTAIASYRAIAKAGMRVFIWSKTGYIPPSLRPQKEPLRGTYWYERVKVALSDTLMPLKAGYFCAYLEMMKFFQELEIYADYVILDTDPETHKYIVPDISIGKKFNEWLRSEDSDAKKVRLDLLMSDKPIDFRKERLNSDGSGGKILMPEGFNRLEIKEYNHIYPEISHPKNNAISVNSYPDRYLPIFRYYLQNIWIPNYCKRYISEKDPVGWTLAEQKLVQLPVSTRLALAGTFIGSLLPALPSSSD